MGWTVLTDVEEIVGDDGWDTAGEFMDKMCEIYMKAVARPPTLHECLVTVENAYSAGIEGFKEKHRQGMKDTTIDWDNIVKNLKAAGARRGQFSVYSNGKFCSYDFYETKDGYDFKRVT